jgi:hypothetical protein
MNSRAVAVASLILLAGCGGGSSNPAPTPVIPVPTASPTPAPGTATATINVPRTGSSAARATRAASSAASLVVTVKSVDGQPPTSAQVPTNPTTIVLSTAPGGNCTAAPSGETCTVTIAAPLGQVVYQFDLVDANNNKLATETLTVVIQPGTSPNLHVALQAIVASVTASAPVLNGGTTFSGPITVQAFDASGTLIAGSAPFANPFTLRDDDPTGATSLSANGVTGAVVTVNAPTDVVTLAYNGNADDPFTLTATIPSKAAQVAGTVQTANQPVALSGTTNDTQRPADPNYNQPTLFFTTIPSTQQFGASQAGWGFPGKPFVLTLDPATCGSGASAVLTFTAATSATFSVTSQHVGVCKGLVTGGPPAHPLSTTIWFSVTTSGIVVN